MSSSTDLHVDQAVCNPLEPSVEVDGRLYRLWFGEDERYHWAQAENRKDGIGLSNHGSARTKSRALQAIREHAGTLALILEEIASLQSEPVT